MLEKPERNHIPHEETLTTDLDNEERIQSLAAADIHNKVNKITGLKGSVELLKRCPEDYSEQIEQLEEEIEELEQEVEELEERYL